MSVRRPASVRFTEDEYALIDAVRDHLTERRSSPQSRADVFRLALRQLKPTDEASPTALRWRDAYSTVFGRSPK